MCEWLSKCWSSEQNKQPRDLDLWPLTFLPLNGLNSERVMCFFPVNFHLVTSFYSLLGSGTDRQKEGQRLSMRDASAPWGGGIIMNYENNREEKRIISAYPVLTRYLIFLSTTSPIRLKNKNNKNVIRLQCILVYHCLDKLHTVLDVSYFCRNILISLRFLCLLRFRWTFMGG